MMRCTARGLWGLCKYEEGHTGPHCIETVTSLTFQPEKEYLIVEDERGRAALLQIDFKIPGLAEAIDKARAKGPRTTVTFED